MAVVVGAMLALGCVAAGFLVSRLVIGRRDPGRVARPDAPRGGADLRVVNASQPADAARSAAAADSGPRPDLAARGSPDLVPPDRRMKRHVIRRPQPRPKPARPTPKPERQAPKPERPPPKKKLLYDDV
jgi:hypothetical protein